VQAQVSDLPRTNASHRLLGRKVGHDAQVAAGDDDGQRVALVNERTRGQGQDVTQASRDRGADAAPLDLAPDGAQIRRHRGQLLVQRHPFAIEARALLSALGLADQLVRADLPHGDRDRRHLGLLLLGGGHALIHVGERDQARAPERQLSPVLRVAVARQ